MTQAVEVRETRGNVSPRKNTGKNVQAPLLTKEEYTKQKVFTVAQVAGLVGYTVVRVWQLLRDGLVKYTAKQSDKRENGILIKKSEIKVARQYLRRADKLHFVA